MSLASYQYQGRGLRDLRGATTSTTLPTPLAVLPSADTLGAVAVSSLRAEFSVPAHDDAEYGEALHHDTLRGRRDLERQGSSMPTTASAPAKRQEWVKPQLQVLCRSNTEESVLTACKSTSGFFASWLGDTCSWLARCQAISSS